MKTGFWRFCCPGAHLTQKIFAGKKSILQWNALFLFFQKTTGFQFKKKFFPVLTAHGKLINVQCALNDGML